MAHEDNLNTELARRVVQLVGEATGHNVNVMGQDGVIIASTDPARVGTIHDGARRIMAGEVDEIAVTPEMAAGMAGTRAGYNGVITWNERRVACIGISGDPTMVKPVQKMAEIVVREELDRLAARRREQEFISSMDAEIADIAERMMVLSLNGSIQAARVGAAGRGFKIVVQEMRGLAAQIQEKVRRLDEAAREA
ncbi:MAG: hypothetical protein KBC36_11235 [Spirochaetia bacterium]|nr:hypothetical protein [Spirochaetia bacterium]